MATEEVLIASSETANDFIIELGKWGKWLQAIGLIVIMWIVIQLINWLINRKRIKKLNLIREDLERIEKKVDKLGRKK